jgi:hypothetical protein
MSAVTLPTTIAFKRYVELLDALLLERAVHGTLSEDIEERFVVAMNDCRQSMAPEEEARVAEIVAQRKSVETTSSLGLVDADPTTDGLPFKKVG